MHSSSPPVSIPFWRQYPYLAITGLHILLLMALGSALYCFGIIRHIPTAHNLTSWDVRWYAMIAESGYSYSTTESSSAAFFPLFPYFWRLTHLDPLGISLVNACLFLASFTWLSHSLQLPPRWALLLLSTPSLLFMFVPYTEALFFTFSTLVLIGLHRGRLSWWLVGLLGCGFTRSASTLFTPALLFMVALWAAQPGQARRALQWGASGLGALLVSVGTVAFVQWYQVGEPLAFMKAQKFWNHFFRVPGYPLYDSSGIDMLWLDGFALWIGFAALTICAGLGWCWLRQKRQPVPVVPPLVLFSLGYGVGVGFFLFFYQGSSVWNASRYMLATPFFVALVWYLRQLPAWPWPRYLVLVLLTLCFWQLFGGFTLDFDNFSRFQAFWYFGLATVYVFAYVGLRQWRWQTELIMLLYCFNMIIQFHLMESWLQLYVVQ